MKEEKNPHSEEEMVLEEENGETHEPDLEEIEERAEDKLKLLREKLQAADEEKRQLLEDLQRAKADFLNSRKRLEEQLERDRERITIKHLEEILPLKDSFDMAMQDPVWNEADEKWRKGVEGIHAQLANVLKSNGITEIEAEGKEFNPYEHEAVSHEGDGDTVVAVLQKGYKKGDTIIRPAKVAVGTK
jgi:molecular chaperone GrpE